MDDLEFTVRGMVASDFATRAEQAYAQHPEIIPEIRRKVKHSLAESSFPYLGRRLNKILFEALQPGVLPTAIYTFWVTPPEEYGPIEDLLSQISRESHQKVQKAYDTLISCMVQKDQVIKILLNLAAGGPGDLSLIPTQIPSAVMQVFKTPDDYFDFFKRSHESSTILYMEGSDFVFGKLANQVLTESVCKTFLEIVAPADIRAIYRTSN